MYWMSFYILSLIYPIRQCLSYELPCLTLFHEHLCILLGLRKMEEHKSYVNKEDICM